MTSAIVVGSGPNGLAAAARLARARYFLALKQPGQAIVELQAALGGNRDAAKSPELVNLLAELHRKENNLPAAREVYAQAISANPGEVRYRLRYTDLLAQLGDKPKAEEQLREAMRHVPPGAQWSHRAS